MMKKVAAAGPVEGPWALPDGWRWERLPQAAAICDHLRRPINNTERLKRNEGKTAHELYPYYGATGQAGVIDGYLADGEYILLGEDGAPFLDPFKTKAYAVSGRFWVNNHAHVLMGKPCLNARLLLHWLNTIRYEPFVNGTTRLKLTQGAMMEMPVPVPPAEMQPRLASRIDELFTEIDDGEAALARARADLTTWRKVLLKAAVTGELTADWRAANPGTETGANLLARIVASRSPRKARKTCNTPGAVESLAVPFNLPASWTWTTLEQIIVSGPTNGYSPKRSTNGEGTQALKLTATTAGRLKLGSNCVKVLSETIPAGSPLYLKKGDLLFQRGNTREYVGMAAIYDGPPEQYIYPDLMIRVTLPDEALTQWIWRWAVSPHGRHYLMEAAQGGAGTMPKISGQTLRSMPVPLPPAAELAIILSTLERLTAETEAGQDDLRSASIAPATLRQSVLAAAFHGELA